MDKEKRKQQFELSLEMNSKSLVLKNLEDRVYDILKDNKINLAFIAESLGIQRNTAYYRLKHRAFSSDDLIKLSNKAVELYKFDF